MRVLLLCEYPSLNGGEHSVLSIAPLLQRKGIEFVALAPSEGPLAESLADLAIPVRPLLTQIADAAVRLSQEELRHQIVDAIKTVKPDLIHANSLAMARLLGPVAAELSVPSVGHIRDIIRLSRRAIADVNLNHQLIAVSAATRDWHVAQGIDAQRIVVAHNGVDVDLFLRKTRSGTIRDKLGVPPEAKLIGAVGQIGMRKGLDVLLEALVQAANAGNEIHAAIAGDRHSSKAEAIEYERNLHEFARAEPLAGRVHFLGRVTDMPDFYNEVDLLVHAARQEPLGRVLLEAGAAAVPIVATRVGGTEEIFSVDSQSAWLVPPADAPALATAIEQALCDPDRRSRADRGREIIAASFSSEHAARRVIEIYRSIQG